MIPMVADFFSILLAAPPRHPNSADHAPEQSLPPPHPTAASGDAQRPVRRATM